MSTNKWAGVSADWNTAADWSLGVVPTATSTASITGTGNFVLTLFGSGTAGGVVLNAAGAEFYDAGTLTLDGAFADQAGTLALGYGAIDGGTLAGVAVQGTLGLTTQEASLFVTGGLSLSGAGGSGAGSIALTGGYASLDFIGSQTLNSAVVSLGASGSQPGQAGAASLVIAQPGSGTAGATLTLGPALWVQGTPGNGEIVVGNAGPLPASGPPDTLVNSGTITASSPGEVLEILGAGTFRNLGTIGVSNGATLELATGTFSNAGSIAISGGTLALGGGFAASLLSNLGAVTLASGQVSIVGTAANAGTLALGTGSTLGSHLGAIGLSGSIVGGTIADGGGGLSFTGGTGVLDGVTYQGTLNLSAAAAAVTLTDSTEVTGASGGAGTILATGAGSELLLRGRETLNNVVIDLGNAGAAAAIATTDLFLASTATTATLGATAHVVQTGAVAALEAVGWSPLPVFGIADTLVNQGTITAGVAGGQLSLAGYGTIVNQGSIAVSGGDTLSVSAGQFANTGTISDIAGGTVQLGQQASGFGAAPSWSNTGLIAVAGGTLSLAGSVAASQLGSITETAGDVVLAGTLSNTGATLALGVAGFALQLQGLSLAGTISGGTVLDPGGVLSSTGSLALLDGVAYQGILALGAAGAFLRVKDGLSLTGTAAITGAGAALDFQGGQTLSAGQITLGGSGAGASIVLTDLPAQAAGATLTLGTGVHLTQSGQMAMVGQVGGNAADSIVSQGTISAAVAGGTLTLAGPGFTNQGSILIGAGETLAIAAGTFINAGSITVNGGFLAIGTSLSLAQLGAVSLNGGALSVSGTLNLGGGTLSVGAGSAVGRLNLTGTIMNGTIVDAGGGLVPTGTATLSNVTYDGKLDLSRSFVDVTVANGITLGSASAPGTITLTGAQTRVLASTSETLSHVTIALGSATQLYEGQKLAAPELDAAAGAQLTLDSSVSLTLSGSLGTLGNAGVGGWSDSIVNRGQILAATQSGTLALDASAFTNDGTIGSAGGGVVVIGDAAFTNAGTLVAGAGSSLQLALLEFYAAPNAPAAAVVNSGTIAIDGGVVHEVTGNGLFPAVPIDNLASGVIAGDGLLFAEVANSGSIIAENGVLVVAAPVSGTGALLVAPGSTLELQATVPGSQSVRLESNSGTLRLDTPSSFAGTVSGLVAGDVISLPSTILTGVGINGGTLVLSTATQNFAIATSAPLGGEVSAGHDSHGGATVTYTAQSGSSRLTVLANQPGMQFWASPVGDVFQGATANFAADHISNWSSTDSLDLTDLNPAEAALAVTQGPNLVTLALTDGSHSATLSLTGTYAASGFHLASDGHGGSLLTFHG